MTTTAEPLSDFLMAMFGLLASSVRPSLSCLVRLLFGKGVS